MARLGPPFWQERVLYFLFLIFVSLLYFHFSLILNSTFLVHHLLNICPLTTHQFHFQISMITSKLRIPHVIIINFISIFYMCYVLVHQLLWQQYTVHLYSTKNGSKVLLSFLYGPIHPKHTDRRVRKNHRTGLFFGWLKRQTWWRTHNFPL